MKRFIKLTLLVLCINTAHTVDQTFSYQGKLLDAGMPANGIFTITIQAYDATTAGNMLGVMSTHSSVQVSAGIFTIDNVNLGANIYDGLDIWLEIRVKSASDASFTALSPRQKIKSVPYATTLIDKGATNGQVLTFDNTTGWQPATPSSGFSGDYNDLINQPTIPVASPWLTNGAGIDYLSDVSIGTTEATHRLTVASDIDDNALRLMGSQGGVYGYGAKLNFGDANYVSISEDVDDSLSLAASNRIALSSPKVGVGTLEPTEQLTIAGNGRAFFGSIAPESAATVGLLIDGVNTAGASRIESYDYTAAEGRTLVINSVGQGAVSIGTGSPASSAKLQVESTTQGFLPPRMTTTQRDAIVSPVNGLTIYNTSTNCNEIYILNAYWDNLCDNMSAVVSAGGRVWLDRNLGAANVGDRGDLYQWGRASEGHEKRDSATTATNATHASYVLLPGVWYGRFITENATPFDWVTPQIDTLWQGLNGANNPCPSGFRLPTTGEWDTERQSWFYDSAAGAWLSPLKLPMTGFRDSDGVIYENTGNYWSSTISNTNAELLYFYQSVTQVDSYHRAAGMAVRCIMD